VTDHDCIKRSTDIPLFYRHKDKDKIAAYLLIERVNDAAFIAGWNANCKIHEFKMCFRDRATIWWESFQEDDLSLDDCDVVKREFLKTYEPKYSAQTTCSNFADLTKKPGECLNDYHVLVQMAYKQLTDNKPVNMANLRLAGATITQTKLEGMNDMAKFFKHQLFRASLDNPLCNKVLEARKDTFAQSLDLVQEL
jgi:Retrotransposon gag protein